MRQIYCDRHHCVLFAVSEFDVADHSAETATTLGSPCDDSKWQRTGMHPNRLGPRLFRQTRVDRSQAMVVLVSPFPPQYRKDLARTGYHASQAADRARGHAPSVELKVRTASLARSGCHGINTSWIVVFAKSSGGDSTRCPLDLLTSQKGL